jgi:seryl-tRNA synthetase
MLDIKFIRKNPDKVKEVCRKKQAEVDIDKLLEIDRKRIELSQAIDDMRAKKNKASKDIVATKDEKEKEEIILKMRELDRNNDKLKENFKAIEKEFKELMLKVPNILLEGVPEGKDETENKVLRKWGKPGKFGFKAKSHVELGKSLDLIDTKTSAEVVGARFCYLKKQAVLLQFALIQYALEVLTSKKHIKKIADSIKKGYSDKTFIPVVPPVMIKPDVFRDMARLSDADKDERYYLPKDDLYLVGSAEHTLGPLHMNQILNEKDTPLRYVGYSTCFRREAGTYGKDMKGILRVHQFDKLEMESFTVSENSVLEQDFFVAIQEYLMQSLKLPYQVVAICTGDIGAPDARQIDIETWIPAQNKYRETHTADLMTDYQARRLNTRVKRKDKMEFAHMNDATAFAIGRTLIAILENYQQKDGSILIPGVLQKYTGFKNIKKT